MLKQKPRLRELAQGTHRRSLVRVLFAVPGVVLYTRTRAWLTMPIALAITGVGMAQIVQPATATAAAANTLNFQARLETAAGAIAADGNYNVRFKLYSGSTGGTAVWTESYLVSDSSFIRTVNGYVTTNLGGRTSFPASINWGQQLYLTMEIGGTGSTPAWDGEMSPRLPLTSVPSAFSLNSFNASNGFTGSLTVAQPTGGNQTFIVPDQGAAGNYSLLTTNAGNANYIQNQNAGVQSGANFYIGGDGKASSSLQAPLFDTPTAGTLNIGTSTATAITLGKANVLTTVAGGLTVNTGSTFTNASSTVLVARILSLGSSGAIGTAATTVDVSTNFNITSTAANLDFTLPTPTASTTAGRLAYVSNVGTNAFTMYGNTIVGGASLSFVYNGSSWSSTTTFSPSGFIQNSTVVQTGANYNIGGNGVIGGMLNVSGATTVNGLLSTNYQSITNQTAANVALNVKAATSQSANIFQVQTSDATNRFRVDQSGNSRVNGNLSSSGTVTIGIDGDASAGQLAVLPSVDTRVGVTVRRAAAQSADLQQFRNNDESIISGFTNQGQLFYQSGSFRSTVSQAALTQSQTITIPASTGATDTICLVTLSNCGSSSSVTTIGTLNGGTINANGASISNNTLFLQSATTSFPGLISTGAQTIAGAKTLTGALTVSNFASINNQNTNALTVGDSANSITSLVVDTTNNKVGIGLAPNSSGATLQVSAGGISTTGAISATGNITSSAAGTFQNNVTSQGGDVIAGNSTAQRGTLGRASTSFIGLYLGNGSAYDSNIYRASAGNLVSNSNLAVQGGNLTLGAASGATGVLTLLSSANNNIVTLQSATQANNVALTIPASTNTTDILCLRTLNNCGGAGSVTTVGALDGGTANATGATISNATIFLQSASASNPGLVNTGTQSFAGNKTFGNNLTVTGSSSLNTTTLSSDLRFTNAGAVIENTTTNGSLNFQANGTGTLALNTTGAGAVQVGYSSATVGIGSTSGATTIRGNATVNGTTTLNGGATVNAQSATAIGLTVRGFASATADLFQLQDSSNAILGGFNVNGQLYNRNSGFTGTLVQGTLTASRTYTLPDATGVICLTTTCGGTVGGTGTANYVARFSAANTIATGLLYDSGTFSGSNITAQLGLSTFGVQARAAQTGLVVQGNGSQNIAEFRNSAGTPLVTINQNGALIAGNSLTVTGSTTLSDFTTAGIVTNSAGGVLGTVAAIPVANGGTGLTTTPGNGQLLIGNGTGYTQAALTVGSNIAITNAAGSITVATVQNPSFSTSVTTPSLVSAAATALSVDSGTTGALNIGTGANAKTITLGNNTGATAVNLNTGTGGFNVLGPTSINTSGTGGTTIGNTSAALTINSTGFRVSSSGVTTLGLGTTNTSSLLCYNGSGQIAGCSTTGTGAPFVQGGNSFGADAMLGTNDNFGLTLETNGAARLAINGAGTGTYTGNFNTNGSQVIANQAAGSTALVVRAASGQTTDVLQIQRNDSAVYFKIDKDGIASTYNDLTVGATLYATTQVNTPAVLTERINATNNTGTRFSFANNSAAIITNATAANSINVISRATAGQTGDLFQLQDSANNSLGGFNNNGQYFMQSGNFRVSMSTASQANNVNLQVRATTAATDYLCLETLNNCKGANAATSIGALDGGTANANGATLSNNVFYLQSASLSFAGVINTAAQSIAGAKTFAALLTGNAGLTVNNGTATNINTTGTAPTNIGNSSGGTVSIAAPTLNITAPTQNIFAATAYTLQAGGYDILADYTAFSTRNSLTYLVGPNSVYNLEVTDREVATARTLNIRNSAFGASVADLNLESGSLKFGTAMTTRIDNAGNFYGNTATIKRTADSTNVFQVQNALGANMLSVDSLASGQLAVNGGAEIAGSFSGNWVAYGTATISRTTTAGQFLSGTAATSVATAAGAGRGVKNNIGSVIGAGSTYLVSFSVKAASGGPYADIAGAYLYDGTNTDTGANNCTAASTPAVGTTAWVKINCSFTAATTSNGAGAYAIYGSAAKTIYIDNFSITRQTTDGSLNVTQVRIGGSVGQGLTVLTVDTAAAAPTDNNGTISQALIGSMYYDTTNGALQCYGSSGWGACGVSPNVGVNLIPEYSGAVLNGDLWGSNNVGTLTSNFCSGSTAVPVNKTSGDQTCPNVGDDYNYYKWTSPQATGQTYSVFVRYQMPATFKTFTDNNTVSLSGRTTSVSNNGGSGLANGVQYGMYYYNTSTGTLTQCGSTTTVASAANTWSSTPLGGNEQSCTANSGTNGGIAANSIVLFRIDVTASNSSNAYVSNLSFLTVGK